MGRQQLGAALYKNLCYHQKQLENHQWDIRQISVSHLSKGIISVR